jgi:hypothetical protein
MKITEDDIRQIRQAMSFLDTTDSEGFSTADVACTMHKSETWCRKKLQQMIVAGSVTYVGKRKSQTIDGRMCFTPVYKFQGR